MPRTKPRMSAEEQAEEFKREAQKRRDHGQPTRAEEEAALDAMVRRSIDLHGA